MNCVYFQVGSEKDLSGSGGSYCYTLRVVVLFSSMNSCLCSVRRKKGEARSFIALRLGDHFHHVDGSE